MSHEVTRSFSDYRGRMLQPSRMRGSTAQHDGAGAERTSVSGELQAWLAGDGDKTMGSLIEVFGEKSFAIVFVLLLGVPALPLPTGGATHVFEIIAALVALELVAGRDRIWLPQRWRSLELAGGKRQRFISGLVNLIRRLERLSRPRLTFLFGHRLSNVGVAGVTLEIVLGSAAIHGIASLFSN
jgi:hypothetical protein